MRPPSAAKLAIAIVAAASSACGARAMTRITAYPELAGAQRIYLADLGDEPGARGIRERIRVELIGTGRYAVVEAPDQADASLIGQASVTEQVSGVHPVAVATEASVMLRLVDTKTQLVAWVFRDSCGGGPETAADCVAESAVEHLLDDAKHAQHKLAK